MVLFISHIRLKKKVGGKLLPEISQNQNLRKTSHTKEGMAFSGTRLQSPVGAEVYQSPPTAFQSFVNAICILTLLVSLILMINSSVDFSDVLSNHLHDLHQVEKGLPKRLNDIQVAGWVFLGIPIVNVGLASGMVYNLNKLRDQLTTPRPHPHHHPQVVTK